MYHGVRLVGVWGCRTGLLQAYVGGAAGGVEGPGV